MAEPKNLPNRHWLLPLLFVAAVGHSAAQMAVPDSGPSVTYSGGQLTINAANTTLVEVLGKITALTGVKIDLPDGVSGERLPMVKLGPGPARQILTSLLGDSNFDYLIQSSELDPDKLQSVLVLARDHDRHEAGPTSVQLAERANPPRPEPAEKEAEKPVVETSAASLPEAPLPPPPSGRPPVSQPVASDTLRPGALSPPSTLNTESISQQLQSMYQQREQMIQQGRQNTAATLAH